MSPQQIKQPSNIAQNKRALERAAKQLEQEIPTANEKALAERLITKLPELTQRKYAVKAMPAKTVIQTFRTQVAVHEVGMDFLIGDLNNETEVDLNNAEFARYEAVKKKLPADTIGIFRFDEGVNYFQAEWTTEGVLIKAVLILNPTEDEIWIREVLTEIWTEEDNDDPGPIPT